jgi:hypothetical protein
MADRQLIFSLARCGSESLVSILNCHPEILCVSEPFNRDNFEGQYLARVKDEASLYEALNDLWKEYTAIKHVWDASGWPFTAVPEFNRFMLQAPGQKIIFLTRKNSLKRIVSLCIAEQTKRWGVFSDEDRTAVSNFSFSEIPARLVNWHLKGEKILVPEYRKILADKKCDFLELFYEDLFDSSCPLEERAKTIAQIFKFLDKKEIRESDSLLRVNDLLATRQTAVDAALLYGRIPNIEEIEKEFGSPETGSLFAAHLQASSG